MDGPTMKIVQYFLTRANRGARDVKTKTLLHDQCLVRVGIVCW